HELALELAKVDLEYRLRAGDEAPRVEEYFWMGGARLSDAGRVELIRWEYQLRWERGERVGRGEYTRQFPEHAEALLTLRPRWDCPTPGCKEGIELDDETSPATTCPKCKRTAEVDELFCPPGAAAGGGLAQGPHLPELDLREYELGDML